MGDLSHYSQYFSKRMWTSNPRESKDNHNKLGTKPKAL
jgi:hypothetical protein